MLFKQEDLSNPLMEAADVLNESVYLDESEYKLSPTAVPVVENGRIGANVVSFEDLYRLSEENGIDYFDAMEAIAEANGIDAQSMAVAVPEWKIIEDPSIVNEMANVVVRGISENDLICESVGYAVSALCEGDDEGFSDYINALSEATKKKAATTAQAAQTAATPAKKGYTRAERMDPNSAVNQMGQNDKDIVAAKAALNKAIATAKSNRPNIIARAIASLRHWAAALEAKHDKQNGGVIDTILKKIGAAIKWLMDKLPGNAVKNYDRNQQYKDVADSKYAQGINKRYAKVQQKYHL